jgi:hypothetical protein
MTITDFSADLMCSSGPLLPQVKGRHGKNSGKLRSLVLPVRLAYRLPLREAQSPQEQMHFRRQGNLPV